MKQNVVVGGKSYGVGRLTVLHLRAILAAQVQLRPLIAGKFTLDGLTAEIVDSLTLALAAVLGAPHGEIQALELAEFVDALRETAVAVISVNEGYLSSDVAPAIERITEALSALLPQLQQQAPGAPAPQP